MSPSLSDIARRINWYTDPERLIDDAPLFLAHVMARGNADDVRAIQQRYPVEALREAYLAAPPGLFTKRAWAYWGLMLLGDAERPMPERFPAANRVDWRKVT